MDMMTRVRVLASRRGYATNYVRMRLLTSVSAGGASCQDLLGGTGAAIPSWRFPVPAGGAQPMASNRVSIQNRDSIACSARFAHTGTEMQTLSPGRRVC